MTSRVYLQLKHMYPDIQITMLDPTAAAWKRNRHLTGLDPLRHLKPTYRVFMTIAIAVLLVSCASYGPYHPNTSS